jgi:hypothetical protein
MDPQVRLLISLQVEPPKGDATRHWLFEDTCHDVPPFPEDFSGQSDVDRFDDWLYD